MYYYKSKQDKLDLVQWVIQKSSNILDVFIISKISKNILTIQSKVFSHFTEKSVVRKHIKSDNQTDNEGEKSFLSALFHKKGSFIVTKLVVDLNIFRKIRKKCKFETIARFCTSLSRVTVVEFWGKRATGSIP